MTRTLWISLSVFVVFMVLGVSYFLIQSNGSDKSTEPLSSEDNNNINQQNNQEKTNNEDSKTYNIDISDFAFSPLVLTINKGDRVVWTNKDSVRHTVTSDSEDGLNSGMLSKDQSYSHTFNTAGTFEYYCEPHPYMKAKIIIR